MTHTGVRPHGTSAPERLAWELYGVQSRSEFLSGASAVLASLLPADTVSWNAVNLTAGLAEVFTSDDTADYDDETVELLAEVAADHPMVTSYLAPAASAEPRRLSDLVSRTDLHRTRTYADLLRPRGAEYQLTILTARQTAASGRCWTLNRQDLDFDDDDRALAVRLQPVLIALDIACDVVGGVDDDVASDLPDPLTRRELEVLGCVARGLTASAVARLLTISERTVRKHLEHSYAKLGCNDRLVAVDRARRLGLLPPGA